MTINVQSVCDELEAVAAIFGATDNPEEAAAMSGGVIEGGMLIYRTAIGPCKLKLVMIPEKAEILARAERLKKTARRNGDNTNNGFREQRRASNWKPSLRQARRSQAVALSFSDDNREAYDELYR